MCTICVNFLYHLSRVCLGRKQGLCAVMASAGEAVDAAPGSVGDMVPDGGEYEVSAFQFCHALTTFHFISRISSQFGGVW